MSKYRLCGGLALMPNRDMALLKRMSQKGWHVCGMSASCLYRFEQGEPQDYDYAVDLQRDFTPEVQDIYRAAGWQSVVAAPGWQIVRAEAGTTPLYTDAESQADTLRENRMRAGRSALVCAFVAVLAFVLEAWFSSQNNELASTICFVVLALAGSGFVITFLPFIGYTLSCAKIRNGR